MNWAAPIWLLGLGPFVLLVLLVVGMARRHHRNLSSVFGEAVLERVLPRAMRWRRGVAATSTLLGLALVLLALAEPRFDKQIRTVRATGVDIVLVLDLSRSMDCTDVEPSRLERARREIADLFRVLQGDRIGLVVFSGGAWPRLPLTQDLAAVQLVLSEADSGTFAAQGSALGDAIRTGVELLGNTESGAGKALLVLSDGEIHEGDDALVAAGEAAAAGVAIYTMGIGEEASPIPVEGGSLMWNGEQVLSAPDDTTLREVARLTGGAYVKSVASPSDVVGLYEGEMRRKLTAVARDAQQREVWRSAFQWPLGIGLLLLLAGAWAGDGRRLLGAATAGLVALLVAGAPVDAMAGTVQEADQLYRSGRYLEAADALTELSLESPTDRSLYDRLGAARYRAGDFEGAARAWDTAARLGGEADVDTLYNAGNAHWRAGRLEEAADRFSEVLGAAPTHEGARQNAEILAKELQARREPPPPPPPEPQDQGEDEENEDGGGEEDQDPSDGGEGEQDPQDGGESDQQSPSGEDSNEDPNQGGESTPELEDIEEGDGEGEDQTQDQVAGGDPSDLGEEQEITEGQAERMLDAVEEGSQRLRVRGQKGNKPW